MDLAHLFNVVQLANALALASLLTILAIRHRRILDDLDARRLTGRVVRVP